MAVKICPNCNRSYPEDALFCKYCGIQLEEVWEEYEEAVTPGGAKCRCPSCGAAVYEEEKVCSVCGYQVGKAGWIKDEKPEQENNNKLAAMVKKFFGSDISPDLFDKEMSELLLIGEVMEYIESEKTNRKGKTEVVPSPEKDTAVSKTESCP